MGNLYVSTPQTFYVVCRDDALPETVETRYKIIGELRDFSVDYKPSFSNSCEINGRLVNEPYSPTLVPYEPKFPLERETIKIDPGKVDISKKTAMLTTLADMQDARSRQKKLRIEKVIFNDPATIVIWKDGTKTVVKAANEPFDPEKGLALAIAKKALGNRHDYYDTFKKWLKKAKKEEIHDEV